MKKTICVFLALILIIPTFTVFAISQSGIVIDSDYSIVVEDSGNVYQCAAARELQKYLSETGISLPIAEKAKKSITICTSGNKSIYADGYRISTSGDSVFIDGRPVRGLVGGVYRFLEEFAGFRMYTSKLKVFNKAQSITVPGEKKIY